MRTEIRDKSEQDSTMYVKNRHLLIRIANEIQRNPAYAEKLGLRDATKIKKEEAKK